MRYAFMAWVINLPPIESWIVLFFQYSEQVCIICTSGGMEVVAAASEEAVDAAELEDTLAILSAVTFYPQWTNNKKQSKYDNNQNQNKVRGFYYFVQQAAI